MVFVEGGRFASRVGEGKRGRRRKREMEETGVDGDRHNLDGTGEWANGRRRALGLGGWMGCDRLKKKNGLGV